MRYEAKLANASWIARKKRHAPHRGEAEPLGRETPPSKRSDTEPHQGQPPGPTKPRTTPTTSTKDNLQTAKNTKHPYLRCLLQFHSMLKSFFLQSTPPAPQVLSKPWRMPKAENLLVLISFLSLSQAAMA